MVESNALTDYAGEFQEAVQRRAERLLAERGETLGKGTVAHEAAELVSGARLSHYGPPVKNHTSIGIMWGVILDRDPIPPRTVAVMMAALKLAREGGPRGKRDNLVDAVGYLLIAEMCGEPDRDAGDVS